MLLFLRAQRLVEITQVMNKITAMVIKATPLAEMMTILVRDRIGESVTKDIQ